MTTRNRAPGYYWVRTKDEEGEHWSVAEWRGPVHGWEHNGRTETDAALDAIHESRILSPVERGSWDLEGYMRLARLYCEAGEAVGMLKDAGRDLDVGLGEALTACRGDITIAAESLGREAQFASTEEQARSEKLLIGLLDSRDAVVREGACIGLAFLPKTPAIEAASSAHKEDMP